MREVKALINDGWEVTVISPKYRDDKFRQIINERGRAYFYRKPVANSAIGQSMETLISLFFGSLLTLWVVIRHGFTVFQACNPKDILWIIALPYKLLGKKFIFDHHDLVPELVLSRGMIKPHSPLLKIFLFLEKCSFRLADAVIATNKSYKEKAISRGGKSPHEVFVVRNGPDLNKFKIMPPKEGLKKVGEVLIGYLGNMNPQDGVDYLLSASEHILITKKLSGYKFILIGGGTSLKSLQMKVRKSSLESSVTFTGRIPDDVMLPILNTCDICVQPDPFNSFNDLSTMNKVLEYMALAKPVVAFDLKETRISCGQAALYAEPNNTIDLAEKIIFLAHNPELRLKIGQLGRERIENMLAWDYSIPYLLQAYQYAISEK